MFNRWDSKLSTEATNDFLTRLAQVHTARIQNAPVREYLDDCCTRRGFPDLCDYVLPVPSLSAADLINASQVLAFFQKRSDLDIGVDRREEALRKFRASEQKCLESNELFRSWSAGRISFKPAVEHALFCAQRKIARVLGEVPKFEDIHPRFGPGATTQLPRKMACAKLKLSQPLACSGDMAPVLSEALATLPHLLPEGEVVTVPVEIHAGKLVTVPKNAKTDRTVMIEPWLNSFFQLGYGQYIADQLRRVGVDLTDQEKNKSLARTGSLTGDIATLDLSSASDTISVGLVEHLLPLDWYLLLSQLRTSIVEVDGTRTTLQKFSSMGNGFTFPLESLIFWALTSSVIGSERTLAVYGDDIIVPTHKVKDVIEVLEACGFSINLEKSFWSGPFRESCGGDYLLGIDVRPCYIKDRMSGHDAFRLHNFYTSRLDFEAADVVLASISEDIRLFGPEGYGDGVLTGRPWAPQTSKRILSRGWGGHLFDSWTYNRKVFKKPVPGDRILPLYSIYQYDDPTAESAVQEYFVNRPYDVTDLQGIAERVYRGSGIPQRWVMDDGSEVGIPEENLPGTKGCRRITIYTLAP